MAKMFKGHADFRENHRMLVWMPEESAASYRRSHSEPTRSLAFWALDVHLITDVEARGGLA